MIKSGKITERPKRFLVYGPEGIGKSTLGSMFPGAVFFDCEEGTNELNVKRAEFSKTWEDALNFTKWLRSENFKTLVIDTFDKLEQIAVLNLCEKSGKKGIEDFGYGKGYTWQAEMISAFLAELDALRNEKGMNIVIISHSQIKKIELPEESGAFDHYELSLSKKVAPLVKEWVDAQIFINYHVEVFENSDSKKKAHGGKDHLLYTTHTAFSDAKNRFGLPQIINAGQTIDSMKVTFEEHFLPLLGSKPQIKKTPQKQKKTRKTTKQNPKETPEVKAVRKKLQEENIPEENLLKFFYEKKVLPEGEPLEKADPKALKKVVKKWVVLKGNFEKGGNNNE